MAIVTTPLGFQKPDGTELVRGGDNVITANAAKAEELHQDARGRLTVIEAKNTEQDAAITAARTDAVADAATYTDAETTKDRTRLTKLEPQAVPTGANIDAYRTVALEGTYRVPDNATYASLTGTKPHPTDTPGTLTVQALTSGAAWQTFKPWYGSDIIYTRMYSPLNFGGYNGWSQWAKAMTSSPPALAGNTDIDAMRTLAHTGRYRVADNTIFNSLVGSKPPQTSPGWFDVEVLTSGVAFQTYRAWYGGTNVYVRSYSTLAPTGWTAWEKLTKVSDVPEAATASAAREGHQMRREMMIRRKGGAIPTAGVGAVCLRLDHGFANIRDLMLPILAKYGVPASVAVNSDTLNVAGESAGVTYTNLAAWGREYGLDYANHSRSHNDATTPAAMEATIVGNLTQMKAGLPDHAVDVYMMPGVSGTQYNGFNAGADLEQYFKHPAGRLMLDNHGLATGQTAGKNIPLTGTPVNGMFWHTLDVNSWITVAKQQIQFCETRGLGTTVMLHPSFLDTAGKTTTAQFESFVAWLAGERDAGRLLILTQAGLAVADAGRSGRTNLVDSVSGALPKTATIAVTIMEWLRGGVLEAQVTVAGAVGDVVTITFGGIARAVTLTAATQTIYRHTVCPLTGTTDMPVTVEATAGTPTLAGVKVYTV